MERNPRAYVGTAALGCPSSEARVLWRRTQRRVIIKSVMATQKSMLDEMKLDQRYAVSAIEDVLTPALLLYPEEIANNIDRTLALLSGDPNRWRVHIKTAKLSYTLKMLLDRGVQNFKCATTLELLTACRTGATDVLLAYPAMGANARRAHEIAQQFPEVQISVLVESEEQVQQWRTRRVGIFLDINPGMNRTGIDQSDTPKIIALVQAVTAASLEFRGLHYYDGQYGDLAEPERTQATHRGYDRLLKIASELERSDMPVAEIITAGTPTFPCSLSYEDFRHGNFIHRISPGTIIYCDATSLHQLPAEYGYRPAALVLTRVVSHPHPGIITCDAGHKTVSADAGIPTCIVLGHPELTSLSPSEEHLPIAVKEGFPPPQIGDALYLLPRHICPTVNNFNDALLVRSGIIQSTEPVSARGRETPLLHSSAHKLSISN